LEEIEHLRFHHPGEPPPAPRTFRGHAALLPIAGTAEMEAAWDEALDGAVTGGE